VTAGNGPMATPIGANPTGIAEPTTVLVAVAMTLTVPLSTLATYAYFPSGVNAMPEVIRDQGP
jgi:hypothetical protein